MDISLNSKFLVFLGKKFYSNDVGTIGVPASNEEFYSVVEDRAYVQPLFHPSVAGQHENMKRALTVDSKRRKAKKHMTIVGTAYLLGVFFVYSILSASISPVSTSSNSSEVKTSWVGTATGMAKKWVVGKYQALTMSEEEKEKRVFELSRKMADMTRAATNREQLEKDILPLATEYSALNGTYIEGMKVVKRDAEALKMRLSNGTITQEQFDKEREMINERKKNLEATQ